MNCSCSGSLENTVSLNESIVHCYLVVIDEISGWIQWEDAQGWLEEDNIDLFSALFSDPLVESRWRQYLSEEIDISTVTLCESDANDFIIEWALKYSLPDYYPLEEIESMSLDEKIEKLNLINIKSVLERIRKERILNYSFDAPIIGIHRLGVLKGVWIDQQYRYLVYKQDMYERGML